MKLLSKLLPLLLLSASSASLIAAETSARPNIVFIMSDDHAKQAISCYGNKDIQTPALDRLARQGMRFNHALTPNSICSPARAAVLTGKYSHKNDVKKLSQPLGSQQTFPKLLQAAGYQTALFGKWHLVTQPEGFDHYCVMKAQGSAADPTVFETGETWIPRFGAPNSKDWKKDGRKLEGYNNDVITGEALTWLKDRSAPKPFCLLLHMKPPHAPYNPAPPGYEQFLDGQKIPEPATLLDDYKGRMPEAVQDRLTSSRLALSKHFAKNLSAKQRKSMSREEVTRAAYQDYIKGYYRLVKSVDDNVARVLDYLKKSGLEKNTLVIYTSDQGFYLGEHGFYNKMMMYEPSLHQPLIIRYPGVIQAETVHHSMVNHVDIAPTLLDFAGAPIPDDLQGYSLKPIVEGRADKVRDASYYHFYGGGRQLPEMIGVRTATHKLIHYPAMKESHQWELFDLVQDPDEMRNLYLSPDHVKVREQLKTELRRLVKDLDDPVEAPDLSETSPASRPDSVDQ